MWKIELDADAKAYINKKKITVLYIEPIKRRVCCTSYGDFVISSKPNHSNTVFTELTEEGVTFHICDSLVVKNDIVSIGHGSFLGVERLFIKNISYSL